MIAGVDEIGGVGAAILGLAIMCDGNAMEDRVKKFSGGNVQFSFAYEAFSIACSNLEHELRASSLHH